MQTAEAGHNNVNSALRFTTSGTSILSVVCDDPEVRARGAIQIQCWQPCVGWVHEQQAEAAFVSGVQHD
jgi:hypothetical protein